MYIFILSLVSVNIFSKMILTGFKAEMLTELIFDIALVMRKDLSKVATLHRNHI